MALYQDKIMDQIKQIGKPRESKSTTVQTAEPQNQPFDMGGLLMMLMMMNMFKDPNAAGGGLASTLGPEMAPGARLMGNVPAQAPPTFMPQPQDDLLSQILLSMLGQPMGGQLPGMPL